MTTNGVLAEENVTFLAPDVRDVREIVWLVRESGALDLNSEYAYLLLCHHFSDTCLVAKVDGRIIGFALAYIPPRQPGTLFVWQIGVSAAARGQGLASRMLDELLDRTATAGVRSLQATVTPSNAASRRLFESLARRRGVECEVTPLFAKDLFSPEGTHEAEELFHVGPRAGP